MPKSKVEKTHYGKLSTMHANIKKETMLSASCGKERNDKITGVPPRIT